MTRHSVLAAAALMMATAQTQAIEVYAPDWGDACLVTGLCDPTDVSSTGPVGTVLSNVEAYLPDDQINPDDEALFGGSGIMIDSPFVPNQLVATARHVIDGFNLQFGSFSWGPMSGRIGGLPIVYPGGLRKVEEVPDPLRVNGSPNWKAGDDPDIQLLLLESPQAIPQATIATPLDFQQLGTSNLSGQHVLIVGTTGGATPALEGNALIRRRAEFKLVALPNLCKSSPYARRRFWGRCIC